MGDVSLESPHPLQKFSLLLKFHLSNSSLNGGKAASDNHDAAILMAAPSECDKESPSNWNLRPKRVTCKKTTVNESEIDPPKLGKEKDKSTVIREADKKKMTIPKFSISLTKEEIEMDLLTMVGPKSVRRPKKKRSKIVQRELDCVFPGLGLSSIKPYSYNVRQRKT
ncbi:hypothetical protein JCGZ_14606 [Jatropha curcas]|uniref:Uncharacterized protein n=1 Tax=Jatropha curcas TaxID=180498 RepID=A0A067K984_JATCU|nr:hypothetical protein JCGZ_14606 [Jatropha curcas]